MAYGVYLPGKWRSPPLSPVEVDWSHPMSRGLISLVHPLYDFDLAHPSRQKWFFYTKSIGGGPLGIAVNQNVEFSNFIQAATNDPQYETSTEASVLFFGYLGSATANNTTRNICYKTRQSVNAPTIGFASNDGSGTTADKLKWVCTTNGADVFYVNDPIVDPNAQVWRKQLSLSCSFTGGTGTFKGYFNGQNTYTATGLGSLLDNIGTNTGERSWVPVGAHLGLYHFVGYWKRGLTDSEHRELSINPFQIYRPLHSIIYSLPSTGGLPTLSNARVTGVTETNATPVVTYTF